MKATHYNVLLLIVSLLLLQSKAQGQIDMANEEAEIFLVDRVTSSSFEMVLYPTPKKLDNSAATKVTTMITNQLLVSSSYPNAAFSFNTIEMLFKGMEFKEDYELEESSASNFENNSSRYVNASLIEFQVVVDIHKQDATLTPPSQFALDNLIVRTFSQPSTKSYFMYLVTQTMDPFLMEIDDIVINYLESSKQGNPIEKKTQLSSIDIILIIISSVMFIIALCVLVPFYYKDGYEDISYEGPLKAGNYGDRPVDEITRTGVNSAERSRTPLEKIMGEGNIVEAGSVESSVDSQSQIVVPVAHYESPVVSYASSHSTSSSSSSASSTDTPPDIFSDEPTDSCYEIEDDSTDSESNEERSQESEELNTVKNDLESKLTRLPGSDVFFGTLKPKATYSSVASAPTVLEDITGKWRNQESKNIVTIRSNRSTASPEYLKVSSKIKKTRRISLHPTVNNRFVSNSLVMLGTTEEFHKSWLESQQRALEDIEEGSIDDVFQIDAQSRDSSAEKNEVSKTSLSTPVSEWMKLIRVVESASETQSAMENSSIEPKVFHAKDSCSIDLSLENSLAKSSVGPDASV